MPLLHCADGALHGLLLALAGSRSAAGFQASLLLLHGFLHFLAALGTGLGALLATFVEDFLRTDQLDEGFRTCWDPSNAP